MNSRVHVVGIGMIPFAKPGASDPYPLMGSRAARLALENARIDYRDIGQAYAGYVFGDSTSGQRALYEVGLTGIPVVNVNNNCATGSTALFLARQAVESGAVDCALALGFEQMEPGALKPKYPDRPTPADRFNAVMNSLVEHPEVPTALRRFGGAGAEHMKRYGTTLRTFAEIRAKASRHAANNPFALFRTVVSADEVLASPFVFPGVMTRLMACPPTCGAAAAVLCTADYAKKRGLDTRVWIEAQALTTDEPSTFEANDMRRLVGCDMATKGARAVFESAGVGPDDVDVIELHDCFAHNELISYEALGLCGEGEAAHFVARGDNSYGGRYVINPSGGLLCKGHPLGATGLAQCFELVTQLRGEAGPRQVEGARIALQHNLGIGGACVITLYRNGPAA